LSASLRKKRNMIRLALDYIDEWSPWLDLSILLRTVAAALAKVDAASLPDKSLIQQTATHCNNRAKFAKLAPLSVYGAY